MRSILLCVAFINASAGSAFLRAAAPPSRQEPVRGIIFHGKAITCLQNEFFEGAVWHQSIHGKSIATELRCSLTTSCTPLRWHIGHGAVRILDCSARNTEWGLQPSSLSLLSYQLKDLLKGRLVPAPNAEPVEARMSGFANLDPVEDKYFISNFTKFYPVTHHDSISAGPESVRLFVLSNVAGNLEKEGETDLLNFRSYKIDRKNEMTPHWLFACYRTRCRWDPKAATPPFSPWIQGSWVKECTFELRFREPFRAVERGDDYYFLTSSGKFYRAAKPSKGKHRKLEVLWDDTHNPVTALITDGDKGRTFLFCDSPRKGHQPSVFELAARPRIRRYDPKLYRPGEQGPATLRRVVGYARILQALQLIQIPTRAAPALGPPRRR